MIDYGYAVEVPEGYDEAVIRARLALRSEGFSILTESHIGGLLSPGAGSERQYLFMSAWNTSIERLVDDDTKVSMHLPCNVVVQETGSSAIVAALDPVDAVEESGPAAEAVTESARAAIERVLRKVVTPL